MQENQLVPAVPPAAILVPVPEFGAGDRALLTEGAKFFTCFSPSTHGGLIASCLDGEDVHFDALIGQEISLRGFVMHEWESVDPKSGDVTDGIRVVLVDDQDRRIGCSGNPVRRTLGYLSQFCGAPPWSPPLKCRLELGKTKAGFRFFKLTYLPPPANNGAAPKAGKTGAK